MSHFTVLVFSEDYDRMLEPFDENIEVEEYEAGEVTPEEKEQFRKYYIEKHPELPLKFLSFDRLYKKYGEKWNGNSYRKEDGVWKSYSTYNPISKWDWYELGGRWDRKIPDNQCHSKEIPSDFHPFAFIDENGKWHEQGQMWYWAIVANEKEEEEWHKEFQEALACYDGIVSLVDCHI